MNSRAIVSMKASDLAMIAEKSPGYSVMIISGDFIYEATNISLSSRNDRRCRAVVEFDYNGKRGRFDADTTFRVID